MPTPWFLYPEVRGFTDMSHGNHDGWDIGAPSHTPLISLTGGKVTAHTGWYPWGGEIDTKGPTGITETFAHADQINVRAGDIVLPGQTVGLSGGENLPRQYSTGPHVHYSLFGGAPWDNKYAIDPSKFLTNVRSNPGSLGVGTMLDSAGGGPDIPGVQGIADAISGAYTAGEAAVAKTVKRIGWFLLGMLVIIIGFQLIAAAIGGRIGKRVLPHMLPLPGGNTTGIGA